MDEIDDIISFLNSNNETKRLTERPDEAQVDQIINGIELLNSKREELVKKNLILQSNQNQPVKVFKQPA